MQQNDEVCSVRVRLTRRDRERLGAIAAESGLTVSEVIQAMISGEDLHDRSGRHIVLAEAEYNKLQRLAAQASLSIGDVLGAIIHEAHVVRFVPGRLVAA